VFLVAVLLFTGFVRPGFFRKPDEPSSSSGSNYDPRETDAPVQDETDFEGLEVLAGNSTAFTITPLPELTLVVPENALDYDRTFSVTRASEADFSEAYIGFEKAGVLLGELYEIDAGLPDHESFPGSYTMSVDLAQMDIPEALYPYIRLYRIGGTGDTMELTCGLEGAQLSCETNKNSLIALGIVLKWGGCSVLTFAASYFGAETVMDYQDKWAGLTDKELMYAEVRGLYRVIWAVEDDAAYVQKKKRINELYEAFVTQTNSELQSSLQNAGYSRTAAYAYNGVLAKKIAESQEYQTLLREVTDMINNHAGLNNDQVVNVLSALEIAHDYLAETRGFKARTNMTDVLLVRQWPAGDTALGVSVNPYGGTPYIRVNLSVFPADMSGLDQEHLDDLYVTLIHELFHVFQTNYTTIDWDSNTVFWEATAVALQAEATRDLYPTVISTQPLLPDNDYYETLSVTFGEVVDPYASAPNEHNGYTLSNFITYLQNDAGYGFTLLELLQKFHTCGTFKEALQTAGEISDSRFSECYRDFCIAQAGKFYSRYQRIASQNNAFLKEPVELSPGNPMAYVPVPDEPLSAYVRAFKIDLDSIPDGKYALLLASDPSLLSKRDYKTATVSAGITAVSRGTFYEISSNPAQYLFEIHSYLKNDAIDASYRAYLLTAPGAPEVFSEDGGATLSVRLPAKSKAAQDGMIDGYKVTITSSDGEVTRYSIDAEDMGELLTAPVEDLTASDQQVTFVVSVCEFIDSSDGTYYVTGPESPLADYTHEQLILSGIYTGESRGVHFTTTGETFELYYGAIRMEETGTGLMIGPCLENGDYESELQVFCTYNAETGNYEGVSYLESGDQWTELVFYAYIERSGSDMLAEVAYVQNFSERASLRYEYKVTRAGDLSGQPISRPDSGSAPAGTEAPSGGGVPVGGF
jgi:hypothetical protein